MEVPLNSLDSESEDAVSYPFQDLMKGSNRDKRFVNVTLTAKGRKVLKQTTPVAEEVVNQTMLLISEDDAALLEKPLRLLRQNAYNGLEHIAKRS